MVARVVALLDGARSWRPVFQHHLPAAGLARKETTPTQRVRPRDPMSVNGLRSRTNRGAAALGEGESSDSVNCLVGVAEQPDVRVIGRYALHDELAAGGMATVHLARQIGEQGLSRTVAIKRLHPQFAKDPEFVAMFRDEARLCLRIRHPNVITTLDVVNTAGELFLVMEFVLGESLSRLARRLRDTDRRVPPRIAAGIVASALHGLHAAHETRDGHGRLLGIVHRDCSPHNILVGADGIVRVIDFGVAKAAGRMHTTREGQLKGKLSYMAPEQIQGQATRQTDVFAASIILWELLTARRLFAGENEAQTFSNVLYAGIERPSRYMPPATAPGGVPEPVAQKLNEIALRGLERDPTRRYATARDMAIALETAVGVASPFEVAEWVEQIAGPEIRARRDAADRIERFSFVPTRRTDPPASGTSDPPTRAFARPKFDSLSEVDTDEVPVASPREPTPLDGATEPEAFTPTPVSGEVEARSSSESVSSQLSSVSLTRPEPPWSGVGKKKHTIGVVFLALGLAAVAALTVRYAVESFLAGDRQPYALPTGAANDSKAEPKRVVARHAQRIPVPVAAPVPRMPPAPISTPEPTRASPTATTAASNDDDRAPAPPPTTRAPSTATPAPKPRVHVAPKPRRPKNPCDPPFTLDSAGRKHYKMECL